MVMSNDAKKRLYIGPEGCGKTTLALRDARREKILLILDLNRQDGLTRNVNHVISASDPYDAKISLLRCFENVDRRKKRHITWQVPVTMPAPDALDFAIRVLNSIGGGALFPDETESFIHASKKLEGRAYTLAKRARHLNPIPLYMTCHKPTELHNVVRTNVHKMCFFDTDDSNGLEFFVKKCRRYHKRDDALKLLNSSKEYEFIQFERGEKPKKMKKIKNT